MRTILILFLVTLNFSCSIALKDYNLVSGEIISSQDANCEKLYSYVKKKWAAHKNNDKCYYHYKKLSRKIIEEKNCFIGLNIKEMVNLFGVPSSISEQNYHYFMQKDCNDKSFSREEYHLHLLVKDNIVQSIEYYPITSIE